MTQNANTVNFTVQKRKKSKAEIGFLLGLMAIPVLHFVVFWLFVNVDSVFLSFQEFDINSGEWKWVWFDNYKDLWFEFTREGSVLPKALLNSFTVFLWNDFVLIPISLFFAYILYKNIPFGNLYKVIFFLPSIISVVVLTLAFRYIFTDAVPSLFYDWGISEKLPFLGFFADPKWAWWMVLFYGLWTGIGGNIVLISGAMARIPSEVIEAGKIDGLSMLKEFWYVVIPLIGSTISTLLLMGTSVIFTYFLQPKLLLGDNAATAGGYTIALYIVSNVRDNGTVKMPMGATIGVMCALIGTPIVVLSRKLLDKLFPVYEY